MGRDGWVWGERHRTVIGQVGSGGPVSEETPFQQSLQKGVGCF